MAEPVVPAAGLLTPVVAVEPPLGLLGALPAAPLSTLVGAVLGSCMETGPSSVGVAPPPQAAKLDAALSSSAEVWNRRVVNMSGHAAAGGPL
jgi:hypothetical protein